MTPAPTPLRPHTPPVALSEVLPGSGVPPVPVSGVTLDSRSVRSGDLYVALPGRLHHGAEFVDAAVRAGAAAVLTDAAGATMLADAAGATNAAAVMVPVVVDLDPRRRMAAVAATVYGRPTDRMTMLGVTGTNGKTTTTYLTAAALGAVGVRTGLVGTIGFSVAGAPLPGTRTTVTTPESPDLQALLAVIAERGAQAVAMEISSHALALGRVDAIEFAACAFTNFGRDHLDFHGSVEAYWAAKASLFTAARTRYAVINLDDPRGPELADQARAAGVVVRTLSLNDGRADYRADRIRVDGGRSHVTARWPDGRTDFTLELPGAFNVRNALTALALADLGGYHVPAAAAGLASASVPGRMQRVPLAGPAPAVYVDFAHTPQAVAAALRAVHDRRTVAVLGCGGDRDVAKREPMGAAAAQEADVVLVTDDNPRTEDPARIRASVLAGARSARPRRAAEIADAGDRRSAIRRALRTAGPDDVVAVLGKGHERGQEIAGVVRPFDDAAVIAEEWSLLTRLSLSDTS